MSLMNTAPAVLGSTVALNMSNNAVLNVDVLLGWLGGSRDSSLDELKIELSAFDWPAGLWAAPLVALSMVGDTLIVAEEWNGTLLADNGLEVFDGLIDLHALDSTASLEHWLEVDALIASPGFKALIVLSTAKGIMLTHFERLTKPCQFPIVIIALIVIVTKLRI